MSPGLLRLTEAQVEPHFTDPLEIWGRVRENVALSYSLPYFVATQEHAGCSPFKFGRKEMASGSQTTIIAHNDIERTRAIFSHIQMVKSDEFSLLNPGGQC